MKFSFTVVSVLSLAFAVTTDAAVIKRQSATTCGSSYYSASQVRTAFNAGYQNYLNGNSPGGYPHTYNNYEGFDFPVSGPYQEFPLTGTSAYTGGSPGAHRVVFSTSGRYAGAITHSGASGNAFVGCSGTS